MFACCRTQVYSALLSPSRVLLSLVAIKTVHDEDCGHWLNTGQTLDNDWPSRRQYTVWDHPGNAFRLWAGHIIDQLHTAAHMGKLNKVKVSIDMFWLQNCVDQEQSISSTVCKWTLKVWHLKDHVLVHHCKDVVCIVCFEQPKIWEE